MTQESSAAFHIAAPFAPHGDQPKAIAGILAGLSSGDKHHVLLGVTGSGKTFTMAHVIAASARPALVMAPNKTLAAQLFYELKQLFPTHAVEYFISYYDYYQPEAYIPTSDTYIAKDSSINDDIDKMRHAATMSLFERRDVIIVASVSCIYGLGSPEAYAKLVVNITAGEQISRDQLLRRLVDIQYSRNDVELVRGHFRARGDQVEILPSHQRDEAVRLTFFGDEIEKITIIDALTGKTLRQIERVSIYPSSHYVTDRQDMSAIVKEILTELGVRLRELRALGKHVEYQRLEQRTMHDIEMLEHIGFCPGIENYSRFLNGQAPGHPPPTLLDYFPKDFLTIIDESHITVPQISGMFRGDRARKQVLVDFGFRLPAALDNRPLSFQEFLARTTQILYVSATPAAFELSSAGEHVTEQILRPTGLIDPQVEVIPARLQVDHLYGEINGVIAQGGRVLVTTLTKKMAEDLTSYYREMGLKIRYLHSDIESLERIDLLRDLRKGIFDVLVGINLLREGLDLPEVMLVAVMDADKEGFLRSKSSLIQIVGRAARNAKGRVIFYADRVTDSMQQCMDETNRRRSIQAAYNEEHGITPQTVIKSIPEDMRKIYGLDVPESVRESEDHLEALQWVKERNVPAIEKAIRGKTKEMKKAAGELAFEKAADLRNQVHKLQRLLMDVMEENADGQ